jgi:LytS/YehU family sensor histidine kinase
MLYLAIRLTFYATSPSWRKHLAAALAAGATSGLYKILLPAVLGAPYPPVAAGRVLGGAIVVAFLYGLMAAGAQAIAYARRDRSAAAAVLQLRADLAEAGRTRAEAELRALKAQLNPHFFGNALSVVSGLLHSDPAAAQRVVAQIDALLVRATQRLQTQEVTLREEIEGLLPFIAVERARFGKRLAVKWEIDETAMPARVPHMILQPLLENAVKHGLWPMARPGGEIVVSGRRAGARLLLTVTDNGRGMRPLHETSEVAGGTGGIGIANTRTRLAELYGHEATFDLEPVLASDESGGTVAQGTIARLSLPWRA